MKLIIPDTNIFVRLIWGLKYYERLLGLIEQEEIKILIHSIIMAEVLSVLLKAKENELFGKVDRERISLSPDVREEIFEDLRRRMVELKVDVMVIGREEVEKTIDKVREVCISAFDALTLVVADIVKPDLIVTDDRLFRNRASEKGYKVCSEENLYENWKLLNLKYAKINSSKSTQAKSWNKEIMEKFHTNQFYHP
ncbi:MAG: PIN domain-containing protein [Nitrososphaerales archaeon]